MDENSTKEKSYELPSNKPLLRAEEVANFLDLSKTTIFRLIKQGKIPAQRFGNSIRIRRVDILKIVNGNETDQSSHSHVIGE